MPYLARVSIGCLLTGGVGMAEVEVTGVAGEEEEVGDTNCGERNIAWRRVRWNNRR